MEEIINSCKEINCNVCMQWRTLTRFSFVFLGKMSFIGTNCDEQIQIWEACVFLRKLKGASCHSVLEQWHKSVCILAVLSYRQNW